MAATVKQPISTYWHSDMRRRQEIPGAGQGALAYALDPTLAGVSAPGDARSLSRTRASYRAPFCGIWHIPQSGLADYAMVFY